MWITELAISTSIKESVCGSAGRTFPRLLTGKPSKGVLDVTSSFSKCGAGAVSSKIDEWVSAGCARQNVVGVAVVVAIFFGLSGCEKKSGAPRKSKPASVQAPWFEEVAVNVGIDFVLQSGHNKRHFFPEITLGGVALCDFDGDGFLDLYLTQGSPLEPGASERPTNRLYRNRGDGTFEDVTDASGTGDAGYGMGCACGDYDNDGDVDLYVANVGANALYRNDGGLKFTNVTDSAGVGDSSWGTSAAFVDYDGDDNLDLMIVNYISWSRERELNCVSGGGMPDYCNPNNYNAPARDTLYRNNGDGTFTDVSVEAGLGKAFGNGLGVACGDFNNDGRMDMYVANDGMRNQLWINQGGGRFSEQALMSGCAVNIHGSPEAGMGVVGLDIENDGDLDLFMSHLRNETNTFYLNTGGLFEDTTATMGLAASSLVYTGFGLGFADFDHDGLRDLYVANGRVMLHYPRLNPNDPYAQPNLLMRGVALTRFEEVNPQGGTAKLLVHTSRAAAFGDLENDGDIDIVVANRDAAPYVLRNVVGHRGRWIMFRIVNRHGSDALGAMVRIDVGGTSHWRTVQPHYGYCSSSDPRVHCGLGQVDKVDAVLVRWPSGTEETFGPFPAGKIHTLREGGGG